MATATETNKPATVDEQISSLAKDFGDLQGSVKEIAKALDRPDARVHGGDGVMSWWESGGNQKAHRRHGGRVTGIEGRPDPTYQNDQFKNAGQYYYEMIRQPNEWMAKCDAIKSRCKAIQGMSTQIGAEGGQWVLPEYSNSIVDDVFSNSLLSMTDSYTVTGNNLTFKANAETTRANAGRHGGMRHYWVDEGGTITASFPRTRTVALRLNKVAVLVYLTEELIEDGGPALGQYVNRKAAEELEFALGDAIINGNGVGQPLGILNGPDVLSIGAEVGQPAATIVTENIDHMWARRRDGGNWSWLHNKDCIPQLDQLTQDVGTSGIALNRPGNSITGAPTQTMKGAPRIETEFNATLGTVGDLILANMGRYITISKGGVMQTASTHVQFLTDQTALKFTLRIDGRSGYVSPLTPYKGSNTQSHFLALATR